MGAKSIVQQCTRTAGGTQLGGTGGNEVSFGVGGSVEDDNEADSYLGAACTISNPEVYVATNSLSTDLEIEIYKNDSSTGCKVTIAASGSPTGWQTGTGTVDIAAGDYVQWRDGTSTGSVDVTMLAAQIESDDTSAITFLNVNNQSSSNLSADSATFYQKPAGGREPQSTEADSEMEFPIAGTLSHFYVITGTVTRTTTCTGRVRVEGSDGNQVLTWDNATPNPGADTTNTDTITAKDKVSYSITNGTGSGESNNIEKMGSTLVNTDGDFFLIHGSGFQFNQNDNLTRFYPLSGNLDDGLGAAASDVELVAPFAFNISELFIRVVEEAMNDDSDLSIHINGSDVGTGITISGSGGAGYHYQTEDIDVEEGDTVCLKLVTGASGTRLRIGYTGICARESSSGLTVTASTDSLVITENSTVITTGLSVVTATDTLAITENATTLDFVLNVENTVDTLVITDNNATVQLGGTIVTSTDSLLLVENSSVLSFSLDIESTTDTLVLTDNNVSVITSSSILTSTDTLTITENSSVLDFQLTVSGTTQDLTITENTNTIVTTDGQYILCFSSTTNATPMVAVFARPGDNMYVFRHVEDGGTEEIIQTGSVASGTDILTLDVTTDNPRLYIDGALVATSSLSMANTTVSFHGAGALIQSSVSGYMTGRIWSLEYDDPNSSANSELFEINEGSGSTLTGSLNADTATIQGFQSDMWE